MIIQVRNTQYQLKRQKKMMYMGKNSKLQNKKQQQKKLQLARAETKKNAQKIKQLYIKFQQNLNHFAKTYKHQINSDSKFRDKFSDMCIQFDVNPMLAEKSIWSELGLGDFYYHLAMNILDICAKHRGANGGLMRIRDVVEVYRQREKKQITKNDVMKAMSKTQILGNASIINEQYVCTIPLELDNNLKDLLALSQKYGFISAKMLWMQYKWSSDEFYTRTMDLRRKGVIWVDKKVSSGPHYYFLNQVGTDFKKFGNFISMY